MTTNEKALPGLHYFCVDVETSALRVWEPDAQLLSIGVTVVDDEGYVVDTFYRRVKARLHESWYNFRHESRSETLTWWREQHPDVQREAFLDTGLHRYDSHVVASHFRSFVLGYGQEWNDRVFVASPDKFDWVWVDKLMSETGHSDPFWYHGLDMWSLTHGAAAQRRTGKNKGKLDISKRFDKHAAVVPHHALSDSFALAQDLCEFLANQPIDLDAPTLEGFEDFGKETEPEEVVRAAPLQTEEAIAPRAEEVAPEEEVADEEPVLDTGVTEEAEELGESESTESVPDVLREG